jgi:type VI secretion system protein ImpK
MNDKPIIRPGGRRPRAQQTNQSSTPSAQQPPTRAKTNLASLAREHGARQAKPNNLFKHYQRPRQEPDLDIQEDSNPLLSLFAPIILLISKVKLSSSDLNLDELKAHAVEQIRYCREISFGMEVNYRAMEEVSYGVCCLLDEMVLNTPWGAKSGWAHESLLVVFHKETWGGERFFEYLEKMSLDPSNYLQAIEFYYAILELGFEGKYRQANDGMRAHQTLKNNTYLLLEKYKNLEPMPLSTKWEGSANQNHSLLKLIPQWVFWSATLALIIVTYFIFSLMLSNQSDPIKRQLVGLRGKGEILVTAHNSQALNVGNAKQIDLKDNNISVYPLLMNAFAEEVAQGLIVIEQQKSGVSVRLTNANLFRSGSNLLAEQYVRLVDKLGLTLFDQRVRINVTGHSDDIPIRTIKYSDNWALSEARADAVKSILITKLSNNSQVFSRGLADTVNLVPNSNAANRALNRRVEILIKS